MTARQLPMLAWPATSAPLLMQLLSADTAIGRGAQPFLSVTSPRQKESFDGAARTMSY